MVPSYYSYYLTSDICPQVAARKRLPQKKKVGAGKHTDKASLATQLSAALAEDDAAVLALFEASDETGSGSADKVRIDIGRSSS